MWQPPKEVLSILPLLTPEDREKIIKDRLPIDLAQEMSSVEASSPTAILPPTTIAWLITSQIIPLTTLQSIEKSITSISPVVRFQSIGFSDRNRISYRIEVVLDRSDLLPRVMCRNRLDRWGTGISLDNWVEEVRKEASGDWRSFLGRGKSLKALLDGFTDFGEVRVVGLR